MKDATPAAVSFTTVSGTTGPIASRIQTVTPRKGSTMTFWDRLWDSTTPQTTGKPGPPHTPIHPLLGEPALVCGKLKMGVPHVVDFGKNMQYSPDGKAYLVGHGPTGSNPKPRPANLSWGTGDQIYMARVQPSIQNINDAAKYEFFAGHDAKGNPLWTHDFSKIKPMVDWNNNCGGVTMTYNPALKKYLMCINDAGNTVSKMNTYILESESITGP
jgi:hypothetical protein